MFEERVGGDSGDFPELANELVRLPVDMLFAVRRGASLAAQLATTVNNSNTLIDGLGAEVGHSRLLELLRQLTDAPERGLRNTTLILRTDR
jgi:hypothetical protein